MKLYHSLMLATGLSVCPALLAQNTTNQIYHPSAVQPVPVIVVTTPDLSDFYQPVQPAPELPTEAEIVLREYRAQKRRAYEAALIQHNARLDEMFGERLAAMKSARAEAIAGQVSSAPALPIPNNDPTLSPVGKASGVQFPNSSGVDRAEQKRQLNALLKEYNEDRITLQEYEARHAKIVAQP